MILWKKTLFKGRSDFNGDVRVVEGGGIRRLIASGFTQSQSLRPDGKTGFRYWDAMVPDTLDLEPDPRILLLGLGAGTVSKIITKRFGPIAIDGVEIDPLIVELGKKYFDMREPNLNIFVEDALDFVKKTSYKYDLICLDVFVGGMTPKGVQDREFLERLKSLLRGNGMLTTNSIFHNDKAAAEGFQKLIKSVFKSVQVSSIRDNIIIYAS
jgi:spermidine synthase